MRLAGRGALGLIGTLIVVGGAGLRATECKNESIAVTDIGRRYSLGQTMLDNQAIFEIPQPGAKYLRAQVTIENGNCQWFLTVRDRYFRPVQTFSPESHLTYDSFWTVRVYGDNMVLDLKRCPGRSDLPKVTVAGYIAMDERANNPYYSRQNDAFPAYQDLYRGAQTPGVPVVPEYMKRLGDSVGLLMSSYGTQAWSCSGTMLRDGMFLTNWHCGGLPPLREVSYWREDVVRDTIIDLSWDGDTVSREYSGTKLLAGSPELDYALLEVAPIADGGKSYPVSIDLVQPQSSMDIAIIHHVEARLKQISRCKIADPRYSGPESLPRSVEFSHKCDTEHGSSGAPVFAADGALIGIHRAGFALDERCQRLNSVNRAVSMCPIISHIREKYYAVYERLKNQLVPNPRDCPGVGVSSELVRRSSE